MSKWMDLSNSANKFKPSYIQGFVDISGGLYIRNDYAVNLYNKSDLTTAKFSIKSDQMRIYDGVNTYYDVSNAKLIYIKDLSENVQTRLTDLNRRTKYINSDASDSNTMMTLDNNNRKIVTYSDIVPSIGNTYNLGSEQYPFGSVFVNDGTIHFVNDPLKKTSASLSYNNSTGLLDLSANGKSASSVLSYGGNVAIGKSTPTATLDVSGNTILSGAVHITATDLSENQLQVDMKTIFNGNVDICGNLYANFPNESIPTSAIVGGGINGFYLVNDTDYITYDTDDFALIKDDLNITGEFDVTVTGNMVVTGDSLMNGNVGIGKSTPTVTLDVSGNTLLSGAVHITSTDLSVNQLQVDLKTIFNGNVDICGNLNAIFPDNSIPPTAIVGGIGGIYIVNDTDRVTYDDDDFALHKEVLDVITTRAFDVTVTGNMVVTGDSSMNGNIYVKTPSYNNNSSLVATTAFVQNQGYATPDITLFRQFI